MQKINKICYLGDDDISRAAVYLSGVMSHFGLPFDRIDSSQSPNRDFTETAYALYIISDYPRVRFQNGQLEHIAQAVGENGSGLLMLGGWESFHGRLGEYHQTVLKDILPVEMESDDDRRNDFQPWFLYPTGKHPVTDGLPWTTPPGIGGFNRFRPKVKAQTLLEGTHFELRFLQDEIDDCQTSGHCRNDQGISLNWSSGELQDGKAFKIAPLETVPMLVVGAFGEGKTAALATDVAPHWVGGFVDWGNARTTQDLGDGIFIEVGNWYADFFHRLLEWTKRSDS